MNNQKPIYIGSRRELFWDDFIIDEATATLRQHKPIRKNAVMDTNDKWGGEFCGYPVVLKDGDIIRLYYVSGRIILRDDFANSGHHGPVTICYAESHDGGKSFIKPDLGLFEHNGSKYNNIILTVGGDVKAIDNFAVFKDTNPNCPKNELYKAVADNGTVSENSYDRALCYYKSADGIHFTLGGQMITGGWFDSLNCCFWDKHSEQYFVYMRDWPEGYHRKRGEAMGTKYRGIRYSTSKDFKTWTECKPLDFGNAEIVELYTNTIKPYYRADHVFLGMPSRYIERDKWEPNFDYLSNPDHRRLRCGVNMRYGTVITDCVLITSRDGKKFNRQSEAFMTPGPERFGNWVYGDCYMTLGLIETTSDLDDAPNEISFYCFDYHWIQKQVLYRYTIRQDGFLSYYSPYKESYIITKLIIFEGSRLTLNMATSAIGYIKVNILDENGKQIPGYESYEVFGDSLDREVVFDKDISELSGNPVKFEIKMSDADIFSFKFES